MSFLDVLCIRSHPVGDNSTELGRARQLDARAHVFRCYVSLGVVVLIWRATESCLAETMTKIVSSAQDDRLAIRFYNDCVF
jgi:hypothetical protein